jgi:uncharacterized membrane protein required for colicin V production
MTAIRNEPVRFWGAITGVVIAVFACLVGFEVVSWTDKQIGLILGVLTSIGVLFQFFFVREQVTPVANPRNNEGEILKPV